MIQHLISYFINDEDLLIWYLVHGLFTDSYCQSPCSSIVRRGSSSSYRDLPGRWRNPYFLGTEVYRNICDPPPLLATLCSGLGKPKVDIPHPTPVGPSQPLREKYHPDQWEQSRLHIRNTSMSIEEHQSQTELKTAISLLYGAFSYILPWTPYAVASLIGQFGPLDGDGQVRWLTPLYATIAAFFCQNSPFI